MKLIDNLLQIVETETGVKITADKRDKVERKMKREMGTYTCVIKAGPFYRFEGHINVDSISKSLEINSKALEEYIEAYSKVLLINVRMYG